MQLPGYSPPPQVASRYARACTLGVSGEITDGGPSHRVKFQGPR